MTEVELKAALTAAQAAALPARLETLGFQAQACVHEVDVYWNGSSRDFRKTDEALRLRSVEDLGSGRSEALITYKGPKQDDRSSTRQEYETSVGDMTTARKLLSALGYRALFTVDKTRRTYTRDRLTVCLDDVNCLGSYVELETVLEDECDRDGAVDALLLLLDCLGISRGVLTRKSYLELLIASATV